MKVRAKHLDYAFGLIRRCLWFLGIWPDPNISVSKSCRINVRFVIVACILSFYTIIPQLTNVIRAWGNVTKIVENVASVNLGMMALCKLIITWYHIETLRKLMISVLADWMTTKRNRERDTMLKIARSGRHLSFQYYVYTALTIMFYTCFNLMRLRRNVALHQQQRRLIYPFTYPYDSQKSPNFEITFIIQISAGILSAFTNFSIDSFVSMLLLHLCAQIMNLRFTLNDLVSDLANRSISSSRFRKRLAAITTRHEHIISTVKTINDSFSPVLFMHMLIAMFQLCFESFQLFTIIIDNVDVSILKIVFLTCYVSYVIALLYVYCYSAEKLSTESTGLAYGVYECKWYELSANDAKSLMFMVYRSKIPLKLTAGKFGNFSLEMFEATVKTAMGYLSALLTIRT